MTRISDVKLRKAVSEIIDLAANGKERFEITQHGKPLVAIVPIEDLRLLEELEDRIDILLVREAMEAYENGSEEAIPLEQVKAELGID
jgi:prevent-host-death family protein